jgi:hypothetical protein
MPEEINLRTRNPTRAVRVTGGGHRDPRHALDQCTTDAPTTASSAIVRVDGQG